MSVFGNILQKIFSRGGDSAPPASQGGATTDVAAAEAPMPSGADAAAGGVAAQNAATAQAVANQQVDVEAVLNEMASKNPQKLNWRTSIVDLMKLVGMESSLAERKQLADELGYTGDKGDTATMNIWLHKQVMKKLEENGGKVPADLMD